MNIDIFENDLVKCELDPDIPVLTHTWLKKPTSEEFRNQLKELQKEYIKQKKEYPGLKWLVDSIKLGELTSDDEQWLKDEWEKLLFVEAGVKVHAVILADDIYADYSMEKFKSKAEKKYAEQGVKLGVFMVPENAYKWLREEG